MELQMIYWEIRPYIDTVYLDGNIHWQLSFQLPQGCCELSSFWGVFPVVKLQIWSKDKSKKLRYFELQWHNILASHFQTLGDAIDLEPYAMGE